MHMLKKAQQSAGSGMPGSGQTSAYAEAMASAERTTIEVKTLQFKDPGNVVCLTSDLCGKGARPAEKPAALKAGIIKAYTQDEMDKHKDGDELEHGQRLYTFRGGVRTGTTVREGKGWAHLAGGELILGRWKGGQMSGLGMAACPYGYTYEGSYFEEKPEGLGRETFSNGDVYLGFFKAGLPHGFGIMVYTQNGSRYEGGWGGGTKHGSGRVRYNNGDVFHGRWSHGLRQGPGVTTYANGRSYGSEWVDDQPVMFGNETRCLGKTGSIRRPSLTSSTPPAPSSGKTQKTSTVLSTFIEKDDVPALEGPAVEDVLRDVAELLETRDLSRMYGLLKTLPSGVFPRLVFDHVKSAFDHLDVDCTGEVDLNYIPPTLGEKGRSTGNSTLHTTASFRILAAKGSGDRSVTGLTGEERQERAQETRELMSELGQISQNGVTVQLLDVLRTICPFVEEDELRRWLMTDLSPAVLWRLRGQLARVPAPGGDTFFAVADVGGTDEPTSGPSGEGALKAGSPIRPTSPTQSFASPPDNKATDASQKGNDTDGAALQTSNANGADPAVKDERKVSMRQLMIRTNRHVAESNDPNEADGNDADGDETKGEKADEKADGTRTPPQRKESSPAGRKSKGAAASPTPCESSNTLSVAGIDITPAMFQLTEAIHGATNVQPTPAPPQPAQPTATEEPKDAPSGGRDTPGVDVNTHDGTATGEGPVINKELSTITNTTHANKPAHALPGVAQPGLTSNMKRTLARCERIRPTMTLSFAQLLQRFFPNLDANCTSRLQLNTLPPRVLERFAVDFEQLCGYDYEASMNNADKGGPAPSPPRASPSNPMDAIMGDPQGMTSFGGFSSSGNENLNASLGGLEGSPSSAFFSALQQQQQQYMNQMNGGSPNSPGVAVPPPMSAEDLSRMTPEQQQAYQQQYQMMLQYQQQSQSMFSPDSAGTSSQYNINLLNALGQTNPPGMSNARAPVVSRSEKAASESAQHYANFPYVDINRLSRSEENYRAECREIAKVIQQRESQGIPRPSRFLSELTRGRAVDDAREKFSVKDQADADRKNHKDPYERMLTANPIFNHLAEWHVGDIALTCSNAQYITQHMRSAFDTVAADGRAESVMPKQKGSSGGNGHHILFFDELMRYAFPNIPCQKSQNYFHHLRKTVTGDTLANNKSMAGLKSPQSAVAALSNDGSEWVSGRCLPPPFKSSGAIPDPTNVGGKSSLLNQTPYTKLDTSACMCCICVFCRKRYKFAAVMSAAPHNSYPSAFPVSPATVPESPAQINFPFNEQIPAAPPADVAPAGHAPPEVLLAEATADSASFGPMVPESQN